MLTVLALGGLAVLLALTARAAAAQSATPPAPVTDDEVNRVAKMLYCPVCENIPLDVCPTTACIQWRGTIREKLEAGWTEQQILDYFVAQYGERVLARPSTRGLNILIAGGTSTGKTTLANALLAEIAATGDRVLVLEDTVELQCAARDHVSLRTRSGVVSMAELVRATMRLRPDRVIVGEVRGGEALDLIKVWGTGHPGGIATIHASSAHGALLRLEQLILEVALTPPRALIAEAVNVIVFIAGRGRARHVQTIARVVGFDGHGYQLDDALAPPLPTISLPSSTTPGELP